MASKRSGNKTKSGGGKAGKRKPKKGTLKDLEAKDTRKIRGGEFSFTHNMDKATPKLF